MYGPHVAISQFNFTARLRKVAAMFISPSNFLTLSLSYLPTAYSLLERESSELWFLS
jgi:hypothetical protein